MSATPTRRVPRVLSIAGSDPSGGAGIQADLKSISALGGYGLAVITALTAQNTQGVTGIHVPPPEFLRAQLDAISADVEIDAVKLGMLGERSVIEVVHDWLVTHRPPVVVLDPVMVSTSGARLLGADAEAALLGLLPLADVVTPNVPELAALTGSPEAEDWPTLLDQAKRLAARHGVRVVAKGGHLSGELSTDALVAPGGDVVQFDAERVPTRSTHGTGCSLSSALATLVAQTADWESSLGEAKAWLTDAVRAGAALEVGRGNGPVDHFVRLRQPTAKQLAAQWWADSAPVRSAIDELPFLTGLADGTLDDAVFRHYLEQDALYLGEYARVLARASALAPTRAEQAFWAEAARGAIVGEAQLHERWLGWEPGGQPDIDASATTRAYLDHLASSGPDYGTVVAAVLPCYWIYQQLGERLAAAARPEHPYRDWLETYGDPDFAAATRTAVAYASAAAEQADPTTRERMRRAFHASAAHELAFFAQEPVTPRR